MKAKNNKRYNDTMLLVSPVAREGFSHPQSAFDDYSKAEWWTSEKFLIFMNIFLAFSDGIVLFSVLERALANSIPGLSVITAAVMAWVLNFLPLLTGRAIATLLYYKKDKVVNVVIIVLTIAIFSLFYAATVWLRFAYGDENGLAIENLNGGSNLAINTLSEAQISARNTILSLEPLVTSIINLTLAIIINPIECKLKKLRARELQLNEEEDVIKSKLDQINNYKYDDVIQDDIEAYKVALHQIAAIARRQQAIARSVLAEYISDPSAISAITDGNNEILDTISQEEIYVC